MKVLVNYTYDGRGNLTGEYLNGNLLHGYRFNAMNRLAEAWDGEGRKAAYTMLLDRGLERIGTE